MKQINEDIKKQNFKQVYLLYGEERYLRRQYRNRLQAALCGDGDSMNTHFYEGKDIPVGEIIDLAETLPFLAERRVIFLTDSGLFKSGGEKIFSKIIEPYRGKIILTDIWGIWCGPCVQALKNSKEEFERLKPYDIIYPYLANNSRAGRRLEEHNKGK